MEKVVVGLILLVVLGVLIKKIVNIFSGKNGCGDCNVCEKDQNKTK